ncbi:MAG: EVE domain-containing protein [Opitutales bacterium]|nr:EVE domain-containing protein [Opitutales bacterium]
MNYWLMKSEPDVFSIDDLAACPEQTEPWDGVRNYQARNFMRDSMQIGDRVLFYHSRCKPPGVVGIAEIVSAAYPDPLAFDKKSNYYDPKSDPNNPRWLMVDVKFVQKFNTPVALDTLKVTPELDGMLVIKRGQRLSIQPVEASHYKKVLELAGL